MAPKEKHSTKVSRKGCDRSDIWRDPPPPCGGAPEAVALSVAASVNGVRHTYTADTHTADTHTSTTHTISLTESDTDEDTHGGMATCESNDVVSTCVSNDVVSGYFSSPQPQIPTIRKSICINPRYSWKTWKKTRQRLEHQLDRARHILNAHMKRKPVIRLKKSCPCHTSYREAESEAGE